MNHLLADLLLPSSADPHLETIDVDADMVTVVVTATQVEAAFASACQLAQDFVTIVRERKATALPD